MNQGMAAQRVLPAPLSRLPLDRRWSDADGVMAVPRRHIHALRPLPPSTTVPLAHRFLAPWHQSPHDEAAWSAGFDFSRHMHRLVADIVTAMPDLTHVRANQILITVTQARKRRSHGLQARVTPLRFRDGHLTEHRHNRLYQVQRYFVGDVEMLYLVTFCLPRFLDQPFHDKLVTIFHELHHISPDFNGDLRRHRGRYCLHTHRQKQYDDAMAEHAKQYMITERAEALTGFLRLNFEQLQSRFGAVTGLVVPTPKLVPVG